MLQHFAENEVIGLKRQKEIYLEVEPDEGYVQVVEVNIDKERDIPGAVNSLREKDPRSRYYVFSVHFKLLYVD